MIAPIFTYLHFTLWQYPLSASTSPFGCSYNNAGDLGLIPGSGRSPGEGNGNSLQYSCLENPMDQRAWWATVHGVTKSRTRLTDFILHTWQVHQSLVPVCLTVVTQEPVWLVELNQMRDLWLERTRDPGALRRFVSLLWWCHLSLPGDLRSYQPLSWHWSSIQKQLSRANLFPNATALLIYKLHW